MGGRGASGTAKLPNSGTRSSNVTASSVAKLTTEQIEKRLAFAIEFRDRTQKIVDGNKNALKTKGSNEEGIRAEIKEDSKVVAEKNRNIKLYQNELTKRRLNELKADFKNRTDKEIENALSNITKSLNKEKQTLNNQQRLLEKNDPRIDYHKQQVEGLTKQQELFQKELSKRRKKK